ncbi:hypothetical protein [Streptomyces violaceusniger]
MGAVGHHQDLDLHVSRIARLGAVRAEGTDLARQRAELRCAALHLVR